MPHHSTKFYAIEIESLHAELIGSSVQNLTCFLEILSQTGNDKMNSLFEFQTEAAEAFKQTNSMHSFIRAKYLHKLFFNANEIDYTDNYLERLNKILHVKGLCIPIIIYNLFLGANINYFQMNNTVLDVASSASGDELSCQVYYLKLNNALRFEDISHLGAASEFEGEITQIFDMNSTITSAALISSLPNGPISIKIGKQCLRLIQGDLNNHQLVKFRKKPLELQIKHASIIKILNHVSKSLIEIKWCDVANNSLVSTYLQYSCRFEKQIWMKQMCQKLLSIFNETAILNLSNLIDYCQIDLYGFLSLSSYNDADEQVLVILIQSEETQVNYFNKLLIVIEPTCHSVIDLRKISLKYDDISIRIDHQNKVYVFKSTGYSQNLKNWYEHLLNASQMKFNSIEDQYLSKENVPLLIEKCCSFVELHLMTEKSFYNDSALKVNQKLKYLHTRLLSEKKFELEENIGSASVLYFLKHFFTTYISDKHLGIFVRKLSTLFDFNVVMAAKISQVQLNKLDDLKVLLDKQIHRNSVFYHTLKRVCIHLNLITHYTYKNDMNIDYLVDLFVTFLFDLSGYTAKNSSFLLDNFKLSHEKFSDKELYEILRHLLDKLFVSMIENCQYLFNLKENFLKIQIEMIERSFDLKNMNKPQLCDPKHESNANIQNFLLTIYMYDKKSGRSFQLSNVDCAFTCRQALMCAKQEFKLDDSKYLSLFEVHDSDHGCMLERPLSVNAVLMNELSSWTSFYLCVKYNMLEMQVNNLDLLNAYEECEFLVYCENSSMHKRWKTGYLSIQNNMLRVFKRNYSRSVEFRNSSSSNIQIEMHTLQSKSNKQLSEIKLEDLVCYLGVYSTDLLKSDSNQSTRSMSMSLNNLANEIQINDQECLTLFDRKNKYIYCIHFQSRSNAFEWYKHLFGFVYESNSWKLFDSDSLPNLAQIDPVYFNIVTDLNQTNSTTLTKIFKKIIHK